MRRHPAASMILVLLLAATACSSERSSPPSGKSGGAPAMAPSAAERDAASTTGAPADAGRMIVRTASLELSCADTAEASTRLDDVLARHGGFVAQATVRQADGEQMARHYTLRVPAPAFGAALADLRGLGKVLGESLGTRDVTEEHVDVESRLRNLRAVEAELLTLMTEARERFGEVNEVLTVFEKLNGVRRDIELLDGRRVALERQVELATIEVALQPVRPLHVVTGTWDPGGTVRRAADALLGVLRGIVDVAIWLVVLVLPVLAVLAIPVLAGAWGLRRLLRWQESRRRRAGRADGGG